MTAARAPSEAVEIFLVAAEASGDRLGAALMRALRERAGRAVHFSGVGGHEMTAAGLDSLYSIDNFSIIGFSAIPRQLPRILSRLAITVRAALARRPHILVVIDSPSYSLWVARFVRLLNPTIKIVDYVSPSIWAWRSGRARAMRRYVDQVLALLPFEPAAHERFGGPPCAYVGHPLIEEIETLRPNPEEAARRLTAPPVVVAMPGSRGSEVARHAKIFGDALGLVQDRFGPIEVIVPTLSYLVAPLIEATRSWPVRPRIVDDPEEKRRAVRIARAALAKSGTGTLELALAGVPTVAAYKVAAIEEWIARRLVVVPSVILANLVLGERVVPELLQQDCTPERLAEALVPLLTDTPERRRQVEAFAGLDAIMGIGTEVPASRAADVVLGLLRPPGKP